MVNYLSNVYGCTGAPLAYMIRDHISLTANATTPLSSLCILSQAHQGGAFDEDNATVFAILHQALLNTNAHTHIAEHELTKDGKAAFHTLCSHYDGPSAVSNRLAFARSKIQKASYTS